MYKQTYFNFYGIKSDKVSHLSRADVLENNNGDKLLICSILNNLNGYWYGLWDLKRKTHIKGLWTINELDALNYKKIGNAKDIELDI